MQHFNLEWKKISFNQTADLTPTFLTHELPLRDLARKYTLEIRDSSGTMLIRQKEGQ